MLVSMNFAVLECKKCGQRIKIEPMIEFDANIHECPKKPLETNKPVKAPAPKKPKKAPTKKTKSE